MLYNVGWNHIGWTWEEWHIYIQNCHKAVVINAGLKQPLRVILSIVNNCSLMPPLLCGHQNIMQCQPVISNITPPHHSINAKLNGVREWPRMYEHKA